MHVNTSVFLAWHDPIALTAPKTLRCIIIILARSIHTLHRILNTEVIVIVSIVCNSVDQLTWFLMENTQQKYLGHASLRYESNWEAI